MPYVLLEDGSKVLLEDGVYGVLLEGGAPTGAVTSDPVVGIGGDVLAALWSLWQLSPALQALTSDGRLWHKVAPEDTQLPYATFFLISEAPEMWTTAAPWKVSTVQFNLHAATDAEAIAMGLAVRSALGRSPAQPSGAPLVIGGSDVVHCIQAGRSVDVGEGLSPEGRDCWVATETFEIPWTT